MATLRILVAEDNELNQKVLAGYLSHLGHSTEIVIGGDQALEALAADRYDAALLDIHMPGTDGLGIVTQLRSGDSSTEVPFLIATTGTVQSDSGQSFIDHGFDGFLPKPIELENLKQLLEQIPHRR